MDNQEKEIGARIKEALDGARISQKALAKATDKAEPTISGYIKGETRIPVFILSHVAKMTNTSINWLVTGKEELTEDELREYSKKLNIAEDGPEYTEKLIASVESSKLPEPIKKAVQILIENEDMAWELYATILERAEKKKAKGQ